MTTLHPALGNAPRTAPAAPTGRRIGLAVGNARWAVVALVVVLLAVTILGPMAYMVYGSLRSAPPGASGILTVQKYTSTFDGEFGGLLATTIQIAALSTVLAVLIGVFLGVVIVRVRIPGSGLLGHLVVAPVYIAPFIGAIAWTALLAPNTGYLNHVLRHVGLGGLTVYSRYGMVWVTGLYFAPLAYLYMRPALLSFDTSLEESARVFGASAWRTLTRVLLPMVLPAILSSVLVVFVNAVGIFAIVAVLGAPSHTDVIATRIIELTTVFPSDTNTAAVLGVLLSLLTVVGLMVNRYVVHGKEYASIGSTGSRAGSAGVGWGRYVALAGCLAYVLVAVVLPIAALVVGSFQKFISPDLSAGWTVHNYTGIAHMAGAVRSIGNSILLAVAASVAGSLLAGLIALIVVRMRGRVTASVDYLSSFPLAVPSSVFGLGMLWMWISIPVGVYGSRWILFICYVALYLPYAVRATVTAMEQIHQSLEDAGRVFGASWLRVVGRVVFPLMLPGMLSGATIILYYSIRELDASLLLYTPDTQVMSVLMWTLHGEGDFTHLFAVSMINLVLVFGLVAGATKLTAILRR